MHPKCKQKSHKQREQRTMAMWSWRDTEKRCDDSATDWVSKFVEFSQRRIRIPRINDWGVIQHPYHSKSISSSPINRPIQLNSLIKNSEWESIPQIMCSTSIFQFNKRNKKSKWISKPEFINRHFMQKATNLHVKSFRSRNCKSSLPIYTVVRRAAPLSQTHLFMPQLSPFPNSRLHSIHCRH